MANRRAIEELFSRYAWGVDVHDVAVTANTFTPDGQLQVDVAGKVAQAPVVGRPAVHAWLEQIVALHGPVQGRHVLTNLHLEDEQDDAATAFAYLTLMVTHDGVLEARATGLYTTHVVRQGDSWLFDNVHLDLDSPTATMAAAD